MSKITEFLASLGCFYTENAPMSEHTTFRIGGKAEVLAEPENASQLAEIVSFARSNDIPLVCLGKGSNVLVSDDGIKGITVLTKRLDTIEYDGKCTVTCGAGLPLIKLCMFALDHSLGGLEFVYGIPGSAGGAAFMNAGAYGGEMKDVMVSCTHINPDGTQGKLCGEELGLSYRHSAYCENGAVITSITVKLYPAVKAEISAKMDDLIGRRKAKQPLEYPSAGSTFKRPEGYFAGALIEECGLKGFSVGGAQVSEKHAGFVINKGGATAKDVFELCDSIQKTVLEKKNVKIEPEIRFIG